MNIILISSVLGTFVLQDAALVELHKAVVSVWPQGSNIYLGECVLLQCTVEPNSTSVWSYRWYKLHAAVTLNPRHRVSGDSYSITAVTREDAGSYWCKAERREGNGTAATLSSQPVVLIVSELSPPSLALTPSTRQIFIGEVFTVQCPSSQTNSTGWRLRRFPPGRTLRTTVPQPDQCLPLGGAVNTNKPDVCIFSAASGNSGLYWCEDAKGRSSAVSITVRDGNVILKTPAFPVFQGENVVLYCQFSTGKHNKATFFKNKAKITSSNLSSPNTVITMTIENVTQEDEGSYKCVSGDGKMESPESWLSVRPNRGSFTSTDGAAASSSASWIWILVSCLVLLLILVPLGVWLVCRYKYQMFSTQSCWPRSKENIPAVPLPATKQDATEVQWDLSWMEMSNLLDKHLYPGT